MTDHRELTVIPHTWIEMQDGTRLSARVWMPADAVDEPVPAVLEYIPYRKGDATAAGDEKTWRYVARQGYACVRVDLRGAGDSDGIIRGEYTVQEQLDGVDVIAWIAAQPWCSGNVGMMGISWGGFTGLQVASHRPPALKAIVSTCSTDDRYADDIHYMGGTVLGVDMLSWATTMLAYNARPPRPEVVGDQWRQRWLERIEAVPAFVEDWLAHQVRDDFWKNGSVCEDYSDLDCAVYMVGGWADAYRNAILRVLENYQGPRKGLIGPWAHNYPHKGAPGPAIGFLQETVRWWDHWLKGIDTGIMDEPMLRAWMPDASGADGQGRWVAESSWPGPGVRQDRVVLTADGSLSPSGPSTETGAAVRVPHSLLHGQSAGDWLGYGRVSDLPPDQQGEDGRSLTFDTEPFAAPVELLGRPSLTVRVSVDRPDALLAARLTDVAPDGSSKLITRGVLNLTHRDGHEFPTALEPGQEYEVALDLNAIAHTVPAGHRIRLALSSTYWPVSWPSPELVDLRVVNGAAALTLPVREPVASDARLRPFEPPESGDLDLVADATAGPDERVVTYDVARRRLTIRSDFAYFGTVRFADGGVFEETCYDEQRIIDGEPLSAVAECGRTNRIASGSGDWNVRVEVKATLTATRDAFHVTNEIDAYEDDCRIATKRTTRAIPRNLV